MAQRNLKFLGLACLMLLAAPSARAQAQGVSLSWHFKPGETLHYIAKQEVILDFSPSSNFSGKGSVATTIDLTCVVKSVDAQQVASLIQTIDRVQTTVDGTHGVKRQYDSASGKEPEEAAKMASAGLPTLVKKPVPLKIDPQGKILEIKLPRTCWTRSTKHPRCNR